VDISRKSIGMMIDELSIINIRCWMAQEKLMNKSLSGDERLKAAIEAQKANAIRSALVNELDKYFNGSESNLGKTYK
jgi:hypothetical protein